MSQTREDEQEIVFVNFACVGDICRMGRNSQSATMSSAALDGEFAWQRFRDIGLTLRSGFS